MGVSRRGFLGWFASLAVAPTALCRVRAPAVSPPLLMLDTATGVVSKVDNGVWPGLVDGNQLQFLMAKHYGLSPSQVDAMTVTQARLFWEGQWPSI